MESLVERHTTAEALNAIVNDPHVRPWVAPGTETLDLTFQVENENNVLLVGRYGCCMFLQIQPGIYEVHTQVLREGRGAWTNALTEACVRWMFLRTNCFEIMTRVPNGHIAAKTAALARGMRYEFTRSAECLFRGRMLDVHIYAFRIQDWLASNPTGIQEIGAAFHDRLHAEAARLGVSDPAHGDDENHNLYVGAAVQMVRAGLPVKGVLTYNRWAIVSRHEPIALVSRDPAVVKIDHGLYVAFQDGDIRVTLP